MARTFTISPRAILALEAVAERARDLVEAMAQGPREECDNAERIQDARAALAHAIADLDEVQRA